MLIYFLQARHTHVTNIQVQKEHEQIPEDPFRPSPLPRGQPLSGLGLTGSPVLHFCVWLL